MTDPSTFYALSMLDPTTEHPLLRGLTEPQRAAVLHDRGPLLVLAAAGSGKTRVITRRIAYLILERGVAPWQVLALTFTNKAAGEMRERVHALLEEQVPERRRRGLTVSTFHSLCARLLRRYAEQADLPGLKPDYSVYDSADQMALCKRAIQALDLSTTNWPPRSVLSAISNAKNDLLDADAFAERASDFYAKQIAKIYSAYSSAMRRAGALDFDDLLLFTARMLRERPEIARECRDRWRYLLIDEYQDTNRAQFEIARLLAGPGRPGSDDAGVEDESEGDSADGDPLAGMPGIEDDPLTDPPGVEPERGEAASDNAPAGPNICVVGDPDQSIYGWRGADISNILDFETHFPGCRTLTLGENFRSTQPILAAADTLIKRNQRRKDKPLFTRRPGGDAPRAVFCRDEQHEATLVADWLKAAKDDAELAGTHGGPIEWQDMAVFYRTNALSRVVEDALRAHSIPYTIARGTAFYQREEIKNVIAYLRVVANTADTVSLERIVNTPARGIGKTTITRLQTEARDRGVPLFDIMADAGSLGLKPAAANAAARFVDLINGWNGSGSFMGAEVSNSLSELVDRVIDESGLRTHYTKQAATSQSEADESRLDNLDEVISSARQFQDEFDPTADPVASDPESLEQDRDPNAPPLLAMLRGYLESVALVADADMVEGSGGSVTLMTLHAAKGLEFPAVAMVGLEEGMLPHSRSFDSDAALEEERRLAFVGITRAMRTLLVTAAKYRTVRGMRERTIASRFFDEIGHELLPMSDQSDDFDGSADNPRHEEPVWAGSRRGGFGGAANGADAGAEVGRGFRSSSQMGLGAEPSRRGPSAADQYPVGTRVRHPQFGEGVVTDASGTGGTARVKIKFRAVGEKTMVLEYARLTRV